MAKIKESDGCVKCGRTDECCIGVIVKDKQGKKMIAKICLYCLAKQADKDGEQE